MLLHIGMVLFFCLWFSCMDYVAWAPDLSEGIMTDLSVKGILKIQNIRCQRLTVGDKCDPYVTLKAGNEKFRTKSQKGTAFPDWASSNLYWKIECDLTTTLRVEVLDDNGNVYIIIVAYNSTMDMLF